MNPKRPYNATLRALKAAETRQRILRCAGDLYCQRGIEEFTLDAVARQAGVTVQTILRGHGSRENLFSAALDHLADNDIPLKDTPPGDVPAAVAAFFDLHETKGDFVIQQLGDETRHPGLKPLLDRGRRHHRLGVAEVFAPQLKRYAEPARTALLNLLVIATDVYVWKLLRRDMAQERPAAEAAVCHLINGITE